MATTLCRIVTCLDGLPPNIVGWYFALMGSYPQSPNTVSSCGIAKSSNRLKPLISNSTVPMDTKLDRMVTYFEWLLPLKSPDPYVYGYSG